MPESARGPAALRVAHSLNGAGGALTESFIGSKIEQHSQIITGTVWTIPGSYAIDGPRSRRDLSGSVRADQWSPPAHDRGGSTAGVGAIAAPRREVTRSTTHG